jgi:hypothetical protein
MKIRADGVRNQGGPQVLLARKLQGSAMSDMTFNHNIKTPTPPPILKKSSKQLIFGIVITLGLIGLVAYGYEAGTFKLDPHSAEEVPNTN